VPTFVGASREGFRPGKLLPKQLTTGEHFTSLKTCEMFRLVIHNPGSLTLKSFKIGFFPWLDE
jgi:hypothetical protein